MKRLAVKAAAAKLKRELKKQVEGSMRAEVEFRKIEDLTD